MRRAVRYAPRMDIVALFYDLDKFAVADDAQRIDVRRMAIGAQQRLAGGGE